jgi:hypothetical protein
LSCVQAGVTTAGWDMPGLAGHKRVIVCWCKCLSAGLKAAGALLRDFLCPSLPKEEVKVEHGGKRWRWSEWCSCIARPVSEGQDVFRC